MKVCIKKNNKVIWSSEYAVSIFEDKLSDNSEYITIDCRICNNPPHFETVSFMKREYDEVVIDNQNYTESYQNYTGSSVYCYEDIEVGN